jgi:hypothetical protein
LKNENNTNNILGKVNGNFNEGESVAIYEQLKGMGNNSDLITLTSGLFKDMVGF